METFHHRDTSAEHAAFLPPAVCHAFDSHLGIGIMIVETMNFVKPCGSSKPLSIVGLAMSLITLALGILFLFWDPMNGLMSVGSGAFIGLFGAVICTLFTIAQIMGINGNLSILGNTTTE